MAQETGQVRQKILMLIPTACARPLAVAMAPQVAGHGVPQRQPARAHRGNQLLPGSPWRRHAMHKDASLLVRIAPLPIVKFQPIMIDVMSPEFEIHPGLLPPFNTISDNCERA